MRVEMITPLVRIYDTAGDHHETQQRKATSQAEFPDKEPIVHTSDPFEEANVIRKSHRIKITGSSPPPPLRSFAELHAPYSAPQRLLANLSESHFHEPTPIQRQAIPAILARREVLAVAPTGSGKTLAFLLPLVIHTRALLDAAAAAAHTKTETTLSRKTRSSKANTQSIPPQQQEQQTGVLSVIVSPTKELSVQTGRVLKPLLPGLRLRCSVLSKATAAGTDFSKVDILLANPLRLGAMATEGAIDLSHVHTLILDEADKLFDLGFTPQIDAVIAACTNKDLIRCLFSATLPETVENLARSVLKDPLRVTIGERNTAVSAVDQRLVFVGRESGKLLALRQLITEGLQPPVLVFVNTKERAKELHRELMYDGVHVDSLHAAQSQAARQIAVDNFRLGKTWVLVATDLVARGMDFAGVNTVVNFDFPCSTTDYIHRVGRTGRAGRSGNAVTLYTEEDVGQLRSIANVIRAAGCEVPEWMLNLKKEKNKYKKRSRSDSGNGGVAGAETITTDPERAKQLVKKKKKTKKKEVELLESRGHLAR